MNRSVTVAVVCYNEKRHITALLDSLISQDYEPKQFEILLIDNNSSDGTLELIQKYTARYPQVRLFVNPVRGIAGSRNLALRKATFDLVAFIDADCEAPRCWLRTLVTGFEKYHQQDDRVVAIGGSNEPPLHINDFYDALHIFLNTFLGSRGSVQGMRFQSDQQVPHLPTVNILFDRKIVLAHGGFDESFGNIGEDQDLSHRLIRSGYKYFYRANAGVIHKLRATPITWFKNMILYGKGRMWLIRKHPDMLNVFFLLPIFLVLGLIASPALLAQPIFSLPLLYFPAITVISIYECKRNNKIHLAPELIRLYTLTHIGYGLGELFALVKNRPGNTSNK